MAFQPNNEFRQEHSQSENENSLVELDNLGQPGPFAGQPAQQPPRHQAYPAAQHGMPQNLSNHNPGAEHDHGYPLRYNVDDESDSTYSDSIHAHSPQIRSPYMAPQVDVNNLFASMMQGHFDDSRYAKFATSTESLVALLGNKNAGNSCTSSRRNSWGSANYAPTTDHSGKLLSQNPRKKATWPAWKDGDVPIGQAEIAEIFEDLQRRFGFQMDNMRNMYDAFMTMLDSRASRMTTAQALVTIHADYIGGENANYKKWFFCAHLDKDDPEYFQTQGSSAQFGRLAKEDIEAQDSLETAQVLWCNRMAQMSPYDRVRQVALYLMIWGEACIIRFTPEVLCFVFKLAWDYYTSPECQALVEPAVEGEYLENIIRPLYDFIRNQQYEVVDGRYVRKEKDHHEIIGYDDVNELFWTPKGIERIVLQDRTTRLMDFHSSQRYHKLAQVHWKSAFQKTYSERRSWLHIALNFARIWIIHIVGFYYYTAANAGYFYTLKDEESTPLGVRFAVLGFGGALASIIMIFGTILEFVFLPSSWVNSNILMKRLVYLMVCTLVNLAPGLYVLLFDRDSKIALIVGGVHFGISLITTFVFATIPSGKLFRLLSDNKTGTSKNLTNRTFTSNFPRMLSRDRLTSFLLWACIFACKFVESYFFLSVSFRDSLRSTYEVQQNQCGVNNSATLCYIVVYITMILMIVLDLILFFLDTYLWYTVWSTAFSVIHSFYLGDSFWSNWRNIFGRLSNHIFSKLLATSVMDVKYKPKALSSQIWNAFVISMYRDHLLSLDHLQALLFQQMPGEGGATNLQVPALLDPKLPLQDCFPKGSEAERRISFFAQSMSMPIPEAVPVERMPTFTVFTPHYAEKILLSLREIIREDDQYTHVTLLEYLKKLHPSEWDNFVKDTKILAEEKSMFSSNEVHLFPDTTKAESKGRTDDLPFYCVGFKSASPEFTLRTRIWASLRAQTLYRTISGFMNYSKALKLLYRVENPEIVQQHGGFNETLEHEIDEMARRKFRFVVSMQRFAKFSKEEQENVDFLLNSYPDLQIAYLEEEPSRVEGEAPRIFSCLIDGYSEIGPDGRRKPNYRILLPGNPILGDGKSDNQNHSIIFTRGEYLQLIDANQDNYIEEALKIRNVLAEFEQFEEPDLDPYAPKSVPSKPPVAIVGAREYIFSENIGVLGDVAAGKEQIWGTLTGRIMAKVGGKLHYGHPDFLNSIFMTTRGGVSKAQKGLHLNEDIYAGMNAFERGGRIKHTEYFQCGKGRDLGFCSVLNFVTKIGTGMGEQMLSREQYYIGTQLPIDRFLTFYYAHPGFHINNIMVMMTVQLFLLTLTFVSSLARLLTPCDYDNFQGILTPPGCYDYSPVIHWVQRTVIAILMMFLVAFLPLFLQVLSEQGFIRSITRLGKHFLSLSPFFEVFVTQIYANSIISNMSFGGARYIGTGRGFATSRIPFSILYARFANSSIYFGMRILLLLLFLSLSMWMPHYIYFWYSAIALTISPFFFNPHQFGFSDFILDYREYLRWLSSGNSSSDNNSWIAHCRLARTRITGYKRKKLGDSRRRLGGGVPRARFSAIFMIELMLPVLLAVLLAIGFSFVSVNSKGTTHAFIRIGVIAGAPLAFNAATLIVLFILSIFIGPIVSNFTNRFGSFMASIAHGLAVIFFSADFVFAWWLEQWELSNAILAMIATCFIHRAVFRILMAAFLTREFGQDESNIAWWSGKWFGRGMGWMAFSLPLREYVCKIIEMTFFATDFVIGHLILFVLFPFCIIPKMDKIHSMMLFWLRPSRQIRPPIYSLKQRRERRVGVIIYSVVFLIMLVFFFAVFIGPLFYSKYVNSPPRNLPF
ncbi:family 48 glycosyltransferase [Basidiobolus meristosporus CBS 931.73]|uniref:1,3-beta-glucan synthase n=1 Tax=Basidiobolus meristosporus CBS 931.73 TaxID=1314790 RepID=A0A1Y1X675_9FUNG|nr:family 48 glycosyltransferase [Basidiobolus meristosporus CBS 931.73]|eukprot:ORX81310.1 family 48 glycosyltransferase [Basidiobolus meristosporus CBS 931.73]